MVRASAVSPITAAITRLRTVLKPAHDRRGGDDDGVCVALAMGTVCQGGSRGR